MKEPPFSRGLITLGLPENGGIAVLGEMMENSLALSLLLWFSGVRLDICKAGANHAGYSLGSLRV